MKFKRVYESFFYIAVFVLSAATLLAADDVTTYLIMSDIPPYKRITQTIDMITEKIKTIPGYTIYSGPGILAGADHFSFDHSDMTYRTEYQSKEIGLGMVVEVTKHTGSDSDKWLLHEIDLEFRNYYGIPGYYIKTINGNTIYVYGAGGRDYRWLSGNKVIMIEYLDSQLTKPEPIEIIQAYLAKHPSSIPAITMKELNTSDNKTKWIKDEMERRLWLCDKWYMQFQLGKVQQKDMLKELVDHMTVFLNYREKYYGISAKDERNALSNYLSQNNGTAIKAKLTEHNTWWTANKTKAINIQ